VILLVPLGGLPIIQIGRDLFLASAALSRGVDHVFAGDTVTGHYLITTVFQDETGALRAVIRLLSDSQTTV